MVYPTRDLSARRIGFGRERTRLDAAGAYSTCWVTQQELPIPN